MSAGYSELRLELCRFGSSTPAIRVLHPQQLSLFFLCHQPISSTDLQLFLAFVHSWDYYYRTQAQGLALLYSPETPWAEIGDLPGKDQLYWIQRLPDCIENPEGLCVLRGASLLHQVNPLPSDLSLYLPARPPALSPAAIAAKIEHGDTSEMIAAYHAVSSQQVTMGEAGVQRLLEYLGSLYSSDFSAGMDWFKTELYGGDRMDVITPADVTFKQFLRRFRNFLVNNTEAANKKSCLRKEREGRIAALERRLHEYDSQIKSLVRTVSERDSTISDLLHKLETSQEALQRLRNEKTRSASFDEAGFWQEATHTPPKAAPSLQEIAAQKSLWILDKSTWSKTESPPAGSLNGCNSTMLLPRPQLEPIVRKVKTPVRMAKSGEWRATKPR